MRGGLRSGARFQSQIRRRIFAVVDFAEPGPARWYGLFAVGPDTADPNGKARIRMLTSGGESGTRVWARLNFGLLGEATHDGDWYEMDVPAGILRPGQNRLALWCNTPLAQTETPLLVNQVFLPVTYGKV